MDNRGHAPATPASDPTTGLSLWLDRAPIETDTELGPNYDDIVVGAGLTGLTTALLLARAGRKVAVLEAREIGAVTTGNTTGKLSLLQGTKLSTMLSRQSKRVVAAYVEANREGQAWLLRFCADHGVPVQVQDAVTYAADAGPGLRAARREHAAAESLGLPVRWQEHLPVPFPSHGGTVLANQAQFNSMDVLGALAGQLREHGGQVFGSRRVVKVSRTGPPTATLDDGTLVHARTVVLATGTPILDRGLYFAKVEPSRSYALAFEHPEPPQLMMLGAGSPSRSVRDAPAHGTTTSRLLLVGGEGHTVGRTRSELARVESLREWTLKYFPGAIETHAWSAQDYSSHDGVPFVGALPRGGGHIFVATGFDKWGMSNGVAAALDLTGQILGDPPSWAKPMHRRLTRPRAAARLVKMNAEVGLSMTLGLAAAELHAGPSSAPSEGQGQVGREGLLPVGRATVAAESCAVVALCTHLGGALKWNDFAKSWDCPLHGSRFSPAGEVLEGPATRNLRGAATSSGPGSPGHERSTTSI
jgi:glycine/D-amino acid oxidase-like deaminating enzyme/nitrite reductase/ring-hydroxylating ferredoxin subunit